MSTTNNIWKVLFEHLTLFLLCSIVFGYFLSSLAFGIWFLYSILWVLRLRQFKADRYLWPFVLFSLFSFASIIWSIDKPQTLHAIIRQLPLFLLGFSGMFLPKLQKVDVNAIFYRFSVFIFVLAIILIGLAIIKYLRYEFEGFLYYHELVSPLQLNAIYVSYIVSFCFLNTLLNTQKMRLSTNALLLTVFGIFLVMLSSKMILLVTMVLALFIILFRLKPATSKLFFVILATFVISLILGVANPLKNRFLSEFNTSYTKVMNDKGFEKGRVYTGIEARLLQIRVFNEIINTPREYILGVGLDASKKSIQRIHTRLNTPVRFQTYNFHNQYVQVLAEIGIIGFCFLGISLALAFRRGMVITSLLPFVILSMALFFSESVLWRQRGILFFGTLYVLLFTVNYRNNEGKKQIR